MATSWPQDRLARAARSTSTGGLGVVAWSPSNWGSHVRCAAPSARPDLHRAEDYDYANLHCWGGTFYDDGNEIYADAGDALRIDSYSNSSVRGQIRIGGETHDFTVLNCGETSYYDRGERGAAGAPEASTGADRPFKTDRSGRWGLRFR